MGQYVQVRIPNGWAMVDQDLAPMWRSQSMRDHTEALKLRVEEYFARQMGMTVPQWREAQARARL